MKFTRITLLTFALTALSVLLSPAVYAVDVKISALPAASALSGPEQLPCVQGGVTSKCTATQVKTWDSSAPTITGHATIEGVTATGATGTGKFVFDGTPTLVTPVLGAATATSLGLPSGNNLTWNSDLTLGRRAAAGFMLGAADAAAPVAQTISVQGARGGTDTNTAAVATTIQGSLGTGTGASGDIVFKLGTPGSTGTTAHTTNTALTLHDAGSAGTQAAQVTNPGVFFARTTNDVTNPQYSFGGDTNSGFSWRSSDVIEMVAGGSPYWRVGVGFGALVAADLQIGAATKFIKWNSADNLGGSYDTGFGRSAAGVLEVNNGTLGTLTNTQIQVAAIGGNNTAKALTESSATTFVKITMTSGSRWVGNIVYSIEANDATDFQVRGGTVPVVAVDKAGVITCTVGTVGAATEVAAVSTGTLTNTFTCADATGNVLNILANATSSLTQTTLQIRYRVEQIGTNVITAQ